MLHLSIRIVFKLYLHAQHFSFNVDFSIPVTTVAKVDLVTILFGMLIIIASLMRQKMVLTRATSTVIVLMVTYLFTIIRTRNARMLSLPPL